MARAKGNDKLVCQHGSFRWVDWQLCRVDGSPIRGFALIAPCEWGDHYLQADGTVGPAPHLWASAGEALDARETWRRQQQG